MNTKPTAIDAENGSSSNQLHSANRKERQAQSTTVHEVDSDSDGCMIPSRLHKGPVKVQPEIIEISSDSDEEEQIITKTLRKQPTPPPQTPSRRRVYSRRPIVHSSDEASDSDGSDDEVVELSDSSDVPLPVQTTNTISQASKSENTQGNRDPTPPNNNSSTFDESTVVFDEPSTARRPVRINPPSQTSVDKTSGDLDLTSISGNKSDEPLESESAVAKPKISKPGQVSKPKAKAAPKPARLNTKKAQMEAELLRRQEYAQQVFDDLNKSVFKKGLPASTKLIWNKRLLTTAGKAKYHRSRDGITTTSIELAEKILDTDERIRNTLSHEMCHLATWVIDEKINEHHGNYFKSWAYFVEKKHPHIEVSVKHNYEISYPFEWKCEKCDKIYGRFSKSIKPEECLCGACKEGKLIPQFSIGRKAAAPKLSRMAAAKPQGETAYCGIRYNLESSLLTETKRKADSPHTVPSAPYDRAAVDSGHELEEEDIQSLAQTLATTIIHA